MTMSDDMWDLFAVVDDNEDNNQDVASNSSETIEIPGGSLFVFDLETVPDESRFPKPVPQEKVVRPDLEGVPMSKLVGGTVPQVVRELSRLSEDQLHLLAEIENNTKKPRSGVLDKIAEELKVFDVNTAYENAVAEWRKLSFNVFACKIVALGIKSQKHEVTMVAKNEDEERAIINTLWNHVSRFRVRCGYNITGFDDAVLIYRSMILGIDATQKLDRRKFGNRQSVDLMTLMFPSGPSQKLKEVCRMLGIVPPAGYEMSGDKVLDLVEAGDWNGIAKYVHSDAVIEFELYRRLADYLIF